MIIFVNRIARLQPIKLLDRIYVSVMDVGLVTYLYLVNKDVKFVVSNVQHALILNRIVFYAVRIISFHHCNVYHSVLI